MVYFVKHWLRMMLAMICRLFLSGLIFLLTLTGVKFASRNIQSKYNQTDGTWILDFKIAELLKVIVWFHNFPISKFPKTSTWN